MTSILNKTLERISRLLTHAETGRTESCLLPEAAFSGVSVNAACGSVDDQQTGVFPDPG